MISEQKRKVTAGFSVESGLIERLVMYCEENGVNKSALVNNWIESYLDEVSPEFAKDGVTELIIL